LRARQPHNHWTFVRLGVVAAMASDGGTLEDSFGLSLTTASSKCAAAVSSYYEAVLAYKPFSAWAVADDATSLDARCPLARVLAADFAFCKGDASRAKTLLEECAAEVASGAAATWTWREERYVKAWSRWCLEGDPSGCYDVLKEVVEKHPQDLFAVKRGHIMGLILGDGSRIMSIVECAAAAVKCTPPPRFLYGMWSFGLEQQGKYEEAEAKAREGLAFEKDLGPDAWLDHSLAHAFYFQGDDMLDEALEFLESRCSSWSATELHPFLYTHNWWHLALLYVEKRSFDKAIQIFDERLWPEKDLDLLKDPQVQLNALNLLWRLDTEGRGQIELSRPRWKKVLAGCAGISLPGSDGAKAPCQHGDLLLDVLLVRAFCATSTGGNAKPLDEWLGCVAAHAEDMAKGSGEGAAERAEAYAVCSRCVAELFRGDMPEAALPARQAAARTELRGLKPRWASLGGSEEQRNILEEAVEGPIVCGAPEMNFTAIFR